MKSFSLETSSENRESNNRESAGFTDNSDAFDFKKTIFEQIPFELVKHLKNSSDTLKDLDFINLNQRFGNFLRIKITDEDRRLLIEIIEKDTKFLSENYLMDYSILLGIEVKGADYGEFRESNFGYDSQRNKKLINSSCGKYIYHVCIIDYIQTFNYVKKGEIILKTVFKNAKSSELSSMRPDKYADRFVKFMKETIFQR